MGRHRAGKKWRAKQELRTARLEYMCDAFDEVEAEVMMTTTSATTSVASTSATTSVATATTSTVAATTATTSAATATANEPLEKLAIFTEVPPYPRALLPINEVRFEYPERRKVTDWIRIIDDAPASLASLRREDLIRCDLSREIFYKERTGGRLFPLVPELDPPDLPAYDMRGRRLPPADGPH